MMKIPVLMYHKISPHSVDDRFNVSPVNFENQLKFIKDQGFISMTAGEAADTIYLSDKIKDESKYIVITFDDGYECLSKHAAPLLERYGIKYTLFYSVGKVGKDAFSYSNRISEVQLFELLESDNFSLESHSFNHKNFTKFYDVHEEDSLLARLYLKHYYGVDARCYCYPYNASEESIARNLAKSGYSYGFTGGGRFFSKNESRFLIPRIGVYLDDSLDIFANKLNIK